MPIHAFAESASLFFIANAPNIVAGIPRKRPIPQQYKGTARIEHQNDVSAYFVLLI